MYTFIVNSANPEKSKKDDVELESLAKYSICHESKTILFYDGHW